MAQFNMEDYEPVHSRIVKFYEKYPDGRIITKEKKKQRGTETSVIMKCKLYKNFAEQSAKCALATGTAHEFRDTELKVNKWGKEYESINYSCWIENCETSAIGRAIANIGLHGDKRPSREEMEKVERMKRETAKKEEEKKIVEQKWNELFGDIDDSTLTEFFVSKGILKEDKTLKDLTYKWKSNAVLNHYGYTKQQFSDWMESR